MAVKRALVYRAGSGVGSTCGAYEVAIERGGRGQTGTMRALGRCTEPPTVTLNGTGLCVDCRDVIQRSTEVHVVRTQQRSRTN
jgi:hypothetical protein